MLDVENKVLTFLFSHHLRCIILLGTYTSRCQVIQKRKDVNNARDCLVFAKQVHTSLSMLNICNAKLNYPVHNTRLTNRF